MVRIVWSYSASLKTKSRKGSRVQIAHHPQKTKKTEVRLAQLVRAPLLCFLRIRQAEVVSSSLTSNITGVFQHHPKNSDISLSP